MPPRSTRRSSSRACPPSSEPRRARPPRYQFLCAIMQPGRAVRRSVARDGSGYSTAHHRTPHRASLSDPRLATTDYSRHAETSAPRATRIRRSTSSLRLPGPRACLSRSACAAVVTTPQRPGERVACQRRRLFPSARAPRTATPVIWLPYASFVRLAAGEERSSTLHARVQAARGSAPVATPVGAPAHLRPATLSTEAYPKAARTDEPSSALLTKRRHLGEIQPISP